MAIVVARRYLSLASLDGPDDYRPHSQLAIVCDSATPAGDYVQGLTLLFEHCAPGDGIPLHTHPHDEAIVIEEGLAEVTLGDERRTVGAGAVVFIPAGKPHGTHNLGDEVLRLHAIFPSPTIEVRYLARNPAPGTEADPPQPPAAFDLRALADG
jgi:quercetin dioxygenase-like cupin family protein